MSNASTATRTCVSFTVTGQLPSMKNSRELSRNRRTGKPMSRKSDKAQRYVADFCAQVPAVYRNLQMGARKGPLRLIVAVYYQSYLSDLDVELLKDCLQLAGVVSNDRHFREEHLYAHLDAKNPRAEIIIEYI